MKGTLHFIFFILALVCFSISGSHAQVPDATWQWTWMHGNNTRANFSVYGTPGVPDPANMPGGRGASFRWTDTLGNFWLFGGAGHAATTTGQLNDLWKYDIATHEWTWMKGDSVRNPPGRRGVAGVPHPDNVPGGRYGSAYWRDTAGNLWLFGGYGYCGIYLGALQDLWKYDIATNEWTWIKGDTLPDRFGQHGTKGVPDALNRPSGRYGTASWTDQDGNFWMFGGTGRFRRPPNTNAQGELNDLWRYSPATNEWTWMHGDSVACAAPVVGTQGTPAAANMPPGLGLLAFWTDASGDFWLYGGMNFCASTRQRYSDLWRYNPATNMWTWMKGAMMLNETAVYGAQSVGAATNTPGAREMTPSTWTDAGGNLWLYGGESHSGVHNDLWKYEIATNEWTWVKGDNTQTWAALLGVYGTRRVGAPANKPGHRELGPATWTDAQGALWLFGGRATSSGLGDLNDLWRLAPECMLLTQQSTITGPDSICAGQPYTYTTGRLNGALTYTWSWPAGWAGSSNDTALTVTPDHTDGTIRVFGTNLCDTSDEQSLDITVIEAEPLEITVNHDTLGTLVPYAAYQWYKDGQPVPGATNRTHVVYENADYSVRVDNGVGCIDSVAYRVSSFLSGLGFRNGYMDETSVKVWPNPVQDILYVESPYPVTLAVHGMGGRLMFRYSQHEADLSSLPSGVYLLSIFNAEGVLLRSQKLLKK